MMTSHPGRWFRRLRKTEEERSFILGSASETTGSDSILYRWSSTLQLKVIFASAFQTKRRPKKKCVATAAPPPAECHVSEKRSKAEKKREGDTICCQFRIGASGLNSNGRFQNVKRKQFSLRMVSAPAQEQTGSR